MKRNIRRILVAIRDLDRVPRSQLRKAATIARRAGARLELFHANGVPIIPEGGRRGGSAAAIVDSVARRSQRRLERLARARVFAGLRVECQAVRDYPPHEAVVRRVLATRADLVVAASRTHHLGQRLLLLNTDWELIRHCPCPILFIKSALDYRRPVLLAAVDPFHQHAKPARLDRQLLATGGAFARILRGQLHVFHAYLPLAMSFIAPLEQAPVWLPAGAEEANTAQVARAFNRLAQSGGVPRGRRHLLMGDVPGRLLATVRRISASIVVMGAVSRSGLRRVFIGSTAERVLDELRCDVLVVKAPGFRTKTSRVRSPILGATLY
jgi:universal stress protein E